MNLYEEYGILVSQMKDLKVKQEEMRTKILGEMVEKDIPNFDISTGKFSIAYTKTWEYPSKVIKLEEDFKAAKAKAQSTKEAKFVETPSLRFTEIKI